MLVAELQLPHTELQIIAAIVLATFASYPSQNQTAVAVRSSAAEALPAVAAMLQSDVSESAAKDAVLNFVTTFL